MSSGYGAQAIPLPDGNARAGLFRGLYTWASWYYPIQGLPLQPQVNKLKITCVDQKIMQGAMEQ